MSSIRKLLIANRGEIACRIIRSCQHLGIETVLACSEADKSSLAARQADEIVVIGPPPSGQSYLKVEAVVEAARASGADAVHPGYGFLSENARLATELEGAGITFIGPSAVQLDAVGDKLKARENALAAKLSVVPGATVQDVEDALKLVDKIGFPMLIKAVSGGGGRGMKLVEKVEQLEEQLNLAIAEAEAAFGDARVYIERYVAAGRHVEVQVLGDGDRAIHLGDRDCSVQRRYQKLVEEAPAPDLPRELQHNMREAAVRFTRHLHYQGAGTVEFLVDVERKEFYFLEMNARIQVEHPVTEMITGIDLIEEQICIAEGHPLRLSQQDVAFQGHAIECRINAEDPANDFMPSPGTIRHAIFPAGHGIRVDTHIEAGAVVSPYYDSLLAKLVCFADSREQVVALMASALQRLKIEGVKTNRGLHLELMHHHDFINGEVTTHFLPNFLYNRHSRESGTSEAQSAGSAGGPEGTST